MGEAFDGDAGLAMDVCRRQLPRDSIRISKERNTITKCWPSQDDVYVVVRDWSGWPKEGGAGSAKRVGVFGTAPQARQSVDQSRSVQCSAHKDAAASLPSAPARSRACRLENRKRRPRSARPTGLVSICLVGATGWWAN